MAFHNILLDEGCSFGSKGGPMYSTTIVTTNNGYEQRNINWDMPLSRWSIGHVIDTEEKKRYFLRFFRNRKGRGHSFLFKDWADYTVKPSTVTSYNEGVTVLISGSNYQLQKKYYDGVATELRNITKIKSGTFTLFNGGVTLTESVDYTLDYNTGILTCAVTFTHWTGEFYFQARFDMDESQLMLDGPVVGEFQDINILEVRE